MCSLIEEKYEKVHSYKSSKKMWDILALAYEGTSYLKHSKISMLVHQYKLFKMEDRVRINQMFGGFQTIIKKNLRGFPWNNFLALLKVHEIGLNKDEGQRKIKSIALKAQKVSKGSSSKAFQVGESCEEAFDEEGSNKDELFFISRKIHSIWKSNSKRYTKEVKDKSQVVCYKYTKPRHFKSECPSLEKEKKKDKKNLFFKKKKEEDEESNISLMVDPTSKRENNERGNI
ncbi:hypothetical protein CR513_21202, partial [Mucuna pruriens]